MTQFSPAPLRSAPLLGAHPPSGRAASRPAMTSSGAERSGAGENWVIAVTIQLSYGRAVEVGS
jgi:hypothetical protein